MGFCTAFCTSGGGKHIGLIENPCNFLVHPTRLERVTFGSVDRCSIQLSYGCIFQTNIVGGFGSLPIRLSLLQSPPKTLEKLDENQRKRFGFSQTQLGPSKTRETMPFVDRCRSLSIDNSKPSIGSRDVVRKKRLTRLGSQRIEDICSTIPSSCLTKRPNSPTTMRSHRWKTQMEERIHRSSTTHESPFHDLRKQKSRLYHRLDRGTQKLSTRRPEKHMGSIHQSR
jgi:hypothetical protein